MTGKISARLLAKLEATHVVVDPAAHADGARFCYLPQSHPDVGAVAVEIAALVASPCAKAFTGCGSDCRTCWSSGPMLSACMVHVTADLSGEQYQRGP